MIERLQNKDTRFGRLIEVMIIVLVLLGAAVLGTQSSMFLFLGLVSLLGIILLFLWPFVGLIFSIIFALLLPLQIETGTEVSLNGVVLFLPVLLGVWLAYRLTRREFSLVRSRTFLPLVLLLIMGLLSILIGDALWDPLVPRKNNLILVQLAQWGIFVLSAIAYFLMANLINEKRKLKITIGAFLVIAGLLAVLTIFVDPYVLAQSIATLAIIRAPFWILLAGIAGGQLLFNPGLTRLWKLFLALIILAVIIYAFQQQQDSVSNWVSITLVIFSLVWMRWPRIRWPLVVITMLLMLTGLLIPAVWEFAGGETEWTVSGASRLVLIERVLEVSMRNPFTGLGLAAYRSYAAMEPLAYGRALWLIPSVNSHNNYVDIFSQMGIIGLGIFLWFMAEVLFLGLRLGRLYKTGFIAGYVNSMIATWVAIMVAMLLLDWFIPFVYNVGFLGFQASVLVWLFFGGLVAIENWSAANSADTNREDTAD